MFHVKNLLHIIFLCNWTLFLPIKKDQQNTTCFTEHKKFFLMFLVHKKDVSYDSKN